MPNCFSLFRRTDGKAEVLNEVDRKMCEHFKVPCDPDKWYMDWYNITGFAVACGRDLPTQIAVGKAWISQSPADEHAVKYLALVEWLHANYTTEAWAEIGKGG